MEMLGKIIADDVQKLGRPLFSVSDFKDGLVKISKVCTE